MDEFEEGQQQQNLATFLEERRWGKRRSTLLGKRRERRPNRRPNLFSGLNIYSAIIFFAIFIEFGDSNGLTSSLSQSASQSSEKQQILRGTSSPTDPLEELRQSAKITNQQLFWQKQETARNRKEERGEREEIGSDQSTRQMANSNILLPYSQYQQILLRKALAEHKFLVEGQQPQQQEKLEMETKEKQFLESDRPIIIRVPANLNAFGHSIPNKNGGAQHKGEEREGETDGAGQQIGDLLFKTGHSHNFVSARKQLGGKAKSSPKLEQSTGHSPSFRMDEFNKGWKRNRVRGHPNPIRPQSNGGIGKWHSSSSRHTIGSSTAAENELEGVGGGGMYGGGDGELPMEYGKIASRIPNSGLSRPSHPSSAENSLITRPSAIFLPSSHRKGNGGERQQYLRPIRPINSGDYGQEKVFLKRIQSAPAGRQLPSEGTAEIAEGEFMDRRLAPPISPNAALAALNQIFGPNSPPPTIGGQPPPQAPLSGSPFDLFNAQSQSAATQNGAAGLISQLPNPLQILSQGSTLQQITTLARNLLQMSNGNQELLSTLSKMMAGTASADGPASKLTSSAVSVQNAQNRVAGEKTAIFSAGNANGTELTAKEAEQVQTLFSSTAAGKTTFGGEQNGTIAEVDQQKDGKEAMNASIAMLNNLPPEQRTLLEAAMKNGELDPENAAQFFASETAAKLGGSNSSGQKQLINAESRLMEWIQQNRPRPGSNPILEPPQKEQRNGTNGMDGGLAKDWQWAMGATDKLPYYGKYCGSFVEQANSTNPHRNRNIAGALWALDERRLLVTKFRFIPLDTFENISFWAGPANFTGNSADFFPTQNGFYLSSLPLDSQTFNLKPIHKMEARIRKMAEISLADDSPLPKADFSKPLSSSGPAERDFLEDEPPQPLLDNQLGGINSSRKRAKRNLYSELYEGNNVRDETNLTTTTASTTTTMMSSSTSKNSQIHTSSTIVPIHFDGNPRNFHLTLGGNYGGENIPRNNTTFSGIEKLSANQMIETTESTFSSPHTSNNNFLVNSRWQSLGWHNGQQPLLLTLPEGRMVKTLNWVALWDHNLKQSLAMVLIPTVASFQVPSIVQLRSFPSAAIGVSGVKKLHSGPIRVLDTKTIEVTEFSFRSDATLPAWFMVGKEIMPNAKGHILPIYDRKTKNFDCDSLREFRNETITLRLPDPLDIKDVFWFAIFSISRGVPFSHIYIPYNDMQLPPDLLALSTPQCIWNSSAG